MCDFDFILLHCTNLFIRQSIDREKNFDVTFKNPPLKNPAYATVRDKGWKNRTRVVKYSPEPEKWSEAKTRHKKKTNLCPKMSSVIACMRLK